ncbi:helix-turn-helix transcriptional regulator [Dactylosporangium sp. NPDC051485]|uniref:helix-turn-helix transcriptional regulator n=1 Tax=Dactylosporangium sp. NPDC051485 TaxID=3154846 RepID=UPI0034136DF4
MEEFASAVLVAAVQRALAGDGIPVVVPALSGALLPLEAKRRTLASVSEEHGLLPLLRVGLFLAELPPDPAISALLASGTPHDLFARWSRLERFTHSRHRVVIREAGPKYLIAEHVGPPAAPPEPAEDALILGVLAALTAAIGGQAVTVRLGTDSAPVVFAKGVFMAPPPGHGTALWHFTWSSLASKVHPAVTDAASHARRILASDLGRRWTLGGLAAELATSTRSLQRRLRAEGGFNALLSATRAEAAADLLMNSEHPLSIVGFASGYADQPHFSRDFKRRTAMTPLAYRSAFASSPAERHSHLGHGADRLLKAAQA